MKCFTRVALCILNGDASLRILSTDASGCFFINVTFIAVAEISIRGDFFFKSYHKFSEFNLFFIHPILFWINELIHLYSIYISSMTIEFHLWYENYRHFQIYLQWKCLNFNYNMKFIPKGPIDYKSALVQVVAWHRTGEKPLPESMLTQFTDAYIRQ